MNELTDLAARVRNLASVPFGVLALGAEAQVSQQRGVADRLTARASPLTALCMELSKFSPSRIE